MENRREHYGHGDKKMGKKSESSLQLFLRFVGHKLLERELDNFENEKVWS